MGGGGRVWDGEHGRGYFLAKTPRSGNSLVFSTSLERGGGEVWRVFLVKNHPFMCRFDGVDDRYGRTAFSCLPGPYLPFPPLSSRGRWKDWDRGSLRSGLGSMKTWHQ